MGIPIFKNPADLYETLRVIGGMFKGDHVEIGTRHGTSAFVIAKARPGAHIFCVDPLETQQWNDQYQGHKETGYSPTLLLEIAQRGLYDRVHLVREYSLPWPLSKTRRFDTALIDGCHIHPVPMWEFEVLSTIVDGAIVLDNIDLAALIGCVTKIRMTPGWVLEYTSRKVAVAWNEQWLLRTAQV